MAQRFEHVIIPREPLGEWAKQAICRGKDPRLFYAESPKGYHAVQAVEEAKAICDTCPVIVECGEHALTAPEPHGVWGGMSERERRRIRRERRIANPTEPPHGSAAQYQTYGCKCPACRAWNAERGARYR